jgi:hydroxymethylpyrimidine pyrophosphatase-like HAD family hydrolase
MYCRVLACDYDGTGAADGYLAPEVATALHAARDVGITTLLVTGRVLADLRAALVDFAVFDAVVAENGAVVWFPATGRTIVLATPPPEEFLGRLRDAGVPFHAGSVVIGTWEGDAARVLALIREMGLDLQLVFNRAAVMLLPSGVDKALGIRRALAELRRSPRNMIAFGDAENDLPMFSLAELAVAARGAVPAVAAQTDDCLSHPGPAGIAQFIARLLEHGCDAPTPTRRRVVLGHGADGPAALPTGGTNLLVSGDPRSGKSWLAGLAAERLIEEGYRLCFLDPEGDHTGLAQRPGVLLLGGSIPLPAAEAVGKILSETGSSVVVNLSGLSHERKCVYVCEALRQLAVERARSGLPHWTVVDEAHYFFRTDAPCCSQTAATTGNMMLVTYRPSLLAAEILPSIQAFLLTRTLVEEERYFVDGVLRSLGPRDLDIGQALRALEMPRAGLLLQTAAGPHWQTFLPDPRSSPHVHHARKYAGEDLPVDKGFHFRAPNDGVRVVARNVEEFSRAVETVPLPMLRHHMLSGDFSRWARDVLGDLDLAAGLAKLEHTTAGGAPPNRAELLEHLRSRYVL